MKPFKSFEEIVKSRDVNSIIKEMEESHLNKAYNGLVRFMAFYSGRDDLEVSDFYGLAHCIYGWMPRMLVYEEELDLDSLKREWESSKSGVPDCPDEEFYPELLKLCGNSIVGLSKLLHFAHPDKYAIIDSNVYKALRLKQKAIIPIGIEKKIPLYRIYMAWISGINENSDVLIKIRKKLKSNNSISKNRLIEFFLYNTGKNL